MLDGAMLVWFVLTGLSLVFVIWDSVVNTPVSSVQKLAWILVVAYTGPVGAFFYLLACRNPGPGMHDAFTKAPWKQGLNSEMHCLAGDATGILIAAVVVPAFGFPNGVDLLFEYASGFIVGLFVFQAMMMVGMYDGNYLKAVRKTFFAETVSMNCVMIGMIPTMLLLVDSMPGSENSANAAFWFRMSLSALVGGVIAFPINHWLVANHLKHGCMTLPGADGPAPAAGHASMEGMDHAAHGGHGANEGMDHGKGSHAEHGGMEMNELSTARAVAWIVGTTVGLVVAVALVSMLTPVSFTR